MIYAPSLLAERPRYGNVASPLATAAVWARLAGHQQYCPVPTNPVGEPLRIRSSPCGDYTLVDLVGDLDILTSGRTETTLHVLLAQQKGSRLVLDLSELTFADARGLRALRTAGRNAAKNGGWVRLACVSEHLRQVLNITETTNWLPVYDTVAAAIGDGATCPSRG